MKKTLLFLSALAVAASAFALPYDRNLFVPSDHKPSKEDMAKEPAKAAGDEDLFMPFGYAEDIVNAYSLKGVGSKDFIVFAMQIPASEAAKFAGAKITSVTITSGSSSSSVNKVRDVQVFVTDNISNGLSNLQSARLGFREFRENEVTLDTPFEVSGSQAIYVGYVFAYPGSGVYYLPVDEVVTNQQSCLVSIQSDASAKPSFQNYATQVGSLGIKCRIEGDNLPVNLGSVRGISVPSYVTPDGGKFNYSLNVKNNGANQIKSVTVATAISNGSSSETTVELASPIIQGTTGTVDLTDVVNNAQGVYEINSTLMKVNGEALADPTSASTTIASYAEGYTRNNVIEEVTGTGCGYCPGGIVTMECIGENYPDWIRIAIHCNWFGADPMTISAYNSMISQYFSANPQAVNNRMVEVPIYGNYPSEYRPIYDMFKAYPAYGDIDLFDSTVDDNGRLVVKSKTTFSTPSDVQHYLSYVVTEDGVGPYNQHNYFAGGGLGAMDGWESKDEYASTIYNEVARAYERYPGISGSLPETIEAGKEYEHSATISLSKVSGNDFHLIGLITNSVTGEIINAKQISMSKSGVKNVADDSANVSVSVKGDEIIVSGAQNVAVYTLDGCAVGTTGLEKGIYIVKADNTTRKVFVK